MASSDTYEVDEVVGRRITREGKEDYLVRWQNYPAFLTTWEPIGNFSNCQAAIQEYFAKNWPIPGSKATSVVHLAKKPVPSQAKKELLTLRALPANRRKRLLRGVRKDLREEILRHQVEEKKFSTSACNELQLPFVLGEETMANFDPKLPPNYQRSLRNRTIGSENRIQKKIKRGRGRPRKQERVVDPGASNGNEQFVVSVKTEYNRPEETLKSKGKLKGRGKRKGRNGIVLPRKNCIMVDSPTLSLPSRLTRQTLPDCSSHCVLEEELVVTNRDGCLYIKICNEAKKNVINRQICEDIIAALHDAGKDEVSLVVISGSGSTFSYGWDLDQFESISHFDRRELLQKFRLLTRMLITCPKPLIAAVNGPAAGFGVSLVSLCDFVFATNQATFQTKFGEWGHPPVGGCSFTLPNLLGTSQAMSVILFNTKLSAATGKQFGLVTDVFGKTDEFEKGLKSNVQRLLSVPLQCLRDTKTLVYGQKVQELEDTNHEECDLFSKYIVNDAALANILPRWRASIRE